MKTSHPIASVLLAIAFSVFAAVAAAAGPFAVTLLKDGKPVSGANVSLQLADVGKTASVPTDADGRASFALDVANVGKSEVSVYVDEDCPNGETRVVLSGANGAQKSECRRRRKIGAFWWRGSGHVTIDVGLGTVVVDSPAAVATTSTPGLRTWSIGAALGYADFTRFDCGAQQSSGCSTKRGTGVYALDIGKQWGPLTFSLGFLKSTGAVEADPRSATQNGGGEQFRIRQEWRASIAYPIDLGNGVTIYPLLGVAHLQGQFSGGATQTCFDVGNGQVSCEPGTGNGGQLTQWTTRGFGGVGAQFQINDRWSGFLQALYEDNQDFAGMDSPRYQIEAGVRFRM